MVDVTEEYLKKFPLGLQKCLQNENEKARFSDEICSDFEPVKVYRGIGHTDRIVPEDFLGNVDRADACNIEMPERNRKRHKWHSHHNWYLFAGANEDVISGFTVEKMEQ